MVAPLIAEADAVMRARTELLYGEFMRRERRRAEARPHLRSALATFESFKARPWADQTRAELRASGETVRRGGTAHGRYLPPRELQIARMVSTGASSKDWRRTCSLFPQLDYRLRKIFTKAGITSRNQLRALEVG
ncbi:MULTISPECIES: hypothetical protein [unclassified Kribbella]|uniref:hypothetical protein n=1 Tax=unclassified Kribbella TaxID=2644121 RepID=UPI0033E7AF7B